jgi:CMP-N,N'-diacetyllegionaminic acid synthase
VSEVLAIITARAGSRRLPGKNVLPLWGTPLVGLACRAARAARCVTRVVLSTEDPELARIGVAHGAEVPFLRPAALAGDDASSFDVLAHLLSALETNNGYHPAHVLLLQPTTPLRRVEDIDDAFVRLQRTRPDGAIVSVVAVKPPSWIEVLAPDGSLAAAPGAPPPALPPGASWVMPNGGFYLAARDYLLQQRGFDGPLTLGHLSDPLLSFDVDTAEEFEVVRRLAEAGIGRPPQAT